MIYVGQTPENRVDLLLVLPEDAYTVRQEVAAFADALRHAGLLPKQGFALRAHCPGLAYYSVVPMGPSRGQQRGYGVKTPSAEHLSPKPLQQRDRLGAELRALSAQRAVKPRT